MILEMAYGFRGAKEKGLKKGKEIIRKAWALYEIWSVNKGKRIEKCKRWFDGGFYIL